MKKVISMALICTLLAALAGCGSTAGTSETVKQTEPETTVETTTEETTEETTEPETEYVVMFTNDWELVTDEETGVSYWKLDEIYCQNPTEGITESSTDGLVQHIAIYAPESYLKAEGNGAVLNEAGSVLSSTGVTYTAANAPMVLHNHSGGYTSSKIQPANIEFLNEGLVHVEIQTRGKEIQNAAGKYIGEFPTLIVDMKAGIRFLRHFDPELPGDAEAIVSTGHSSGGAVSALLGASGDSAIFDEYFEEIGAYDESDIVFVAHASAPITNLNTADASYEWFQKANPEYFLFNAMAFDREGNDISATFPVGPSNMYKLGSNILGGAHEDELSSYLYDWYVKYVQDLGFDLGDDGRSGEFYDGFIDIYEDALAEYIARYDELTDPNAEGYKTLDEYLAGLGEGWFTYDAATGEVTIKDLDTLVKNHIKRKKMCPSLDSYNYKSNENNAFKDEDGNLKHFSDTVYEGLVAVKEAYDKDKSALTGKDGGEFTAEDLAYLEALIGDYKSAGSEEEIYMLDVMSPINYVIGKEGFEATSAAHWRLRIGSADGDHGAPAAWLIYQAIEEYQPDVDAEMGIAWGFGHVWSELTNQDFFDYISEIMKEDKGVK